MEKKTVDTNPSDLAYTLEEVPPTKVMAPLVLQQLAILSSNLVYPVMIAGALSETEAFAGNFVAVMLLLTGVVTILQAMRKNNFGSGFLCIEESGSMYFSASLLAVKTGGLSLLCGMTAIAGVMEIIFSKTLSYLRFLFPPAIIGVVIASVGISIIRAGVSSFFGVNPGDLQATYNTTATIIGTITLATAVGINIWGKAILRQYSIVLGILAGYFASYYLGVLTDDQLEKIGQASLLALPELHFTGISFDGELLLPFLAAAVCSSIKTIGNITTCQKINDRHWRRLDLPTTQGGLLAEGIGNVISAVVGGMGLSSSSGSVGLSITTKATSRRIAFVTGGACILLALFPKLILFFTIIPKPVMGAILIINTSFIILAGLQIVTSRMLDSRKTFVVGISLVFGLGADMLPELYRSFPELIQPLLKSSLSVTAATAILLNWLFRIGISQEKTFVLNRSEDTAESIFRRLEAQGRVWGVRPEVIHKAAASLSEFVDSAAVLGVRGATITATLKFDEFNLDAFLSYEGELIDFGCERPSIKDLLENENVHRELSCFLIKKYSDTAQSTTKNGFHIIHLHYTH